MLSARSKAFVSDDLLGKTIEVKTSFPFFLFSLANSVVDPRLQVTLSPWLFSSLPCVRMKLAKAQRVKNPLSRRADSG